MLDYRETTSRSQEMIERIQDAADKRNWVETAKNTESPTLMQQFSSMAESILGKLYSGFANQEKPASGEVHLQG